MTAQMSLVSLAVKVMVASVPGAEELLVSSMMAVLVVAMALGFLVLVWYFGFWYGQWMVLVCEAEALRR